MSTSTMGNGIERGTRIGAIAALWLVPIFIFSLAFTSGWVSTWRCVGVPSMTPNFLDLWSIPTSVETMPQGGDPLVMNSGGPYRRPINYPRIGLYLFAAAGITRNYI